MGDNDTQLAALLMTVQQNLRGDIRDSEGRLSNQIAELRDEHGERLEKLEKQRGGIGLTKAQKRALWTVASGIAVEAAGHVEKIASGAKAIAVGLFKLFIAGQVRP